MARGRTVTLIRVNRRPHASFPVPHRLPDTRPRPGDARPAPGACRLQRGDRGLHQGASHEAIRLGRRGQAGRACQEGPFSLVNIGSDGWFSSDDGKFQKIPAGGAQARADKVRDDEKQGKGRCEPLGERKVGTDPVVGYMVRNNGKGEDYAALHVWISKSTGLPVYHGLGETNGFRWVYGTDVAAPPAGQVTK